MIRGFEVKEECIEEFKKNKTEDGAAECIRCLIMNKEVVYWDDGMKRLKCAAEVWDSSWEELMTELTRCLEISNRDEYIEKKNKHNLTQY